MKRLFEPAGYVVDKANDGDWFISGGDLATCSTPKEVRIVTSQLVKDANSVLTLANGDYRHVHASGDIIENDKHFHTAIEIPGAEVRVKGQPVVVEPSGHREPPYERHRRWLEAGKIDADVQAMLDLFNSGVDHEYYRAYENI